MNPKHERILNTVSHWLESIIDTDATPLLLIAQTTHGTTHRVHIYSDATINAVTALAILDAALRSALHHENDLDLLIAPTRPQ